MTRPRLLAVGAAHIDRRGRVSGAYVAAASNPGTIREEVGGGAFNAARNAVRHGADAAIASLRGGDAAGETVARAIAAAGLDDLSATFLDRTTPSYTALIDAEGELIAGLADMGLYEAGFPRQIGRRGLRQAAATADAVLVDANMPAAAIERLAAFAAGRPLHAIAISPAKAGRLKAVLGRLSCLFMNGAEARVLAGMDENATPAEAAGALRAVGLKRGIITAGADPLTGFDADGVFTLTPPRPRAVVDVTGAGDALAGTTVAWLMRGAGFREAARRGVTAALLTVESPAVVADHGDAEFEAALALVAEARAVA